MDDALPSGSVAVRQGCRFLLFLVVFLQSVTSISSFDLTIRPHRLDWILEGTTLEFTCSFKNRNRPEAVVWKNGEQTIGRTAFGNACAVPKFDPQIDITCNASSSKLRILGVSSTDRWSLRCQTGNGTARSRSVKVKVLRKSELIISPKTNPLIKEEGSSATMSCRVEGQGHYPFSYPSFTWFKNDLRIVQSTFISTGRCLNGNVVLPPDNLITLCGSYYSRVDIRNISLDDAGIWRCGYGPLHFDIKSQPIRIIVEKKATTTAQEFQVQTTRSLTDSSTLRSEHLIQTGSEMTSPTSIIPTNGMTTNEETVASSSYTTSSTTTTTPSTQSSNLLSTYKRTSSYSRSETTTTVLPTSPASTTTSESFSTANVLPSTKTSTLTSSSTTLSTLTPIPTSMSMPTSTTSTSRSPTSSTITPIQTSVSTSLSTEISTSTSSASSSKVTSTSPFVSTTQSNSSSKSYQTLKTTVLQTSPELITQSNHEDFSADSKPIVSSSSKILTTISSPTRFSPMMNDTSTPSLNGSDVTRNNGSTRGVEVVLEGGTTRASLILIGCIIVAVVAIIIIVTTVVVIRRRKNGTAGEDNSDNDFRVEGWDRQSWDTDSRS